MSDANTPAPAGTDDARPMSLESIADSLPNAAFGLADEPPETPEPTAAQPETPAEAAQPAQDGDEPLLAADDAPESDTPPAEAPEGEEKPAEQAQGADFIEVDGQKLTRDEVRRGYLRQADYTKKTQIVSGAARELQAERAELETQRNQVNEVLTLATEAIGQFMPKPPDAALANSDPVRFIQQKAAYDEAAARVQQIIEARQKVGEQQGAERQKTTEAERREAEEALGREMQAAQAAIPELKAPETARAFYDTLVKCGERHGISAEEIYAVRDHRQLVVLKKAAAYDALQAKAPQAMERVKSAPPIPAAARQSGGTRQGEARARAQDAFRRNPTIENAAAALPNELFGIT